jgi:hypothetical protein
MLEPDPPHPRVWHRAFEVLASISLVVVGTTAEAAPAYRKTITINVGSPVSGGPYANFPLLFNTTDPALRTTANGGQVTNPNGWDIIFATVPNCADSTSCGGKKLDHEVERYTPTTGELVAWVRVPSLDDGTVLYIHYGDPAVVAPTENKTGVWDASYQAVWHLSEAPANGASGGHIDSKHNTAPGALFNNGTPQGFTSAPSSTNATGIAAGADRFFRPVAAADPSNDDTIDVTDHATLEPAADMTLEAWVNASTLPAPGSGNVHVLAQKNYLGGPPFNSYQLYFRGDPGATRLWFGWTNTTLGAYSAINAGPFSPGTWYHVAGVLAGDTVTLYVDGRETGTTTATKAGTLLDTADPLTIGNALPTSSDSDGVLDEVRLSSAARSPGWLLTQYRNVSSPGTFYSLTPTSTNDLRTGSYIGNGAPRAIGGVGFQPDVVILKGNESTVNRGVIGTSSMGPLSKGMTGSVPALAGLITSLDGDGFSLSGDAQVNQAGLEYQWTRSGWCPASPRSGPIRATAQRPGTSPGSAFPPLTSS